MELVLLKLKTGVMILLCAYSYCLLLLYNLMILAAIPNLVSDLSYSIISGYSFGNVLADGATSPPRRFFKSAARKDNSKLDENAENAIETKEKKEFADSKPKQSTLNESSTSSPSESRDCIHKVDNQNAMNGKCSSSSLSCEKSESDSSDIPSASSDSISDKTMRQSRIGIGADITPPSAFSRRNIPQTEVNMFDLVGHQDDNHGK